MRKSLDGLRWEMAWLSELGCLKGCLGYLGREFTFPRLYGLTAHAFLLNMHETCCPSGPTAWDSGALLSALLPNLGGELEYAAGGWPGADLAKAQAEAWELTRRYLDAGHPVYGWHLALPEYYVITGYDATGYYYHGPMAEEGAGPKPWRELGSDDIGIAAVVGMKPCRPNSVRASLLDALEMALRHADPEARWSGPGYHRGPAAFEVWAKALDSGSADEFGHRYCAAVWSECRHQAVQFLKELEEHLEGVAAQIVGEALISYRKVANLLGAVSAEHVFLPPHLVAQDTRLQNAQSAEMLRHAGEAERAGLEQLERLRDLLAEA